MAGRHAVRRYVRSMVAYSGLVSSCRCDHPVMLVPPFPPDIPKKPNLSPAERIQKERGYAAIATGSYRYVRHPMYATFILFVLGASLLLGSWYGVLASSIFVVIIARRAVLKKAC